MKLLEFTPDNHFKPVYRFGRFHRLLPPGYSWIVPKIETATDAISVGLRVDEFVFTEVLSANNIPFELHLTVLYRLDLAAVAPTMLPQVVRLAPTVVTKIVRDYTNRDLRRLASNYKAEVLASKAAASRIECQLGRILGAQLRVLGITPLRSDGVLIKEIVAPESFQNALLDAKRQQTLLRLFHKYSQNHAIDYALWSQFLHGLENHKHVTLFGALDQLHHAHTLSDGK